MKQLTRQQKAGLTKRRNSVINAYLAAPTAGQKMSVAKKWKTETGEIIKDFLSVTPSEKPTKIKRTKKTKGSKKTIKSVFEKLPELPDFGVSPIVERAINKSVDDTKKEIQLTIDEKFEELKLFIKTLLSKRK